MTRLFGYAGSFALAALLVAASPASVRADDKDVIDYRQHIMKSLDAQVAALGQILTTVIPDTNLASHLEVIALTASQGLKSFEPKVPGGESKPEVWAKWDDFSKRMNDFARLTREAATIAKTKGNQEAANFVVDALTCKQCHDLYREKK